MKKLLKQTKTVHKLCKVVGSKFYSNKSNFYFNKSQIKKRNNLNVTPFFKSNGKKQFDFLNLSFIRNVRYYSSDYPNHQIIKMPALSPTMEKGNLVSWQKKEGDAIEVGDIIALVETDKATIDFETTEEGYIAKILVEGGTKDVPLGSPLAVLVEDESSIDAFKDYKPEQSSSQPEEKQEPSQEEEQPAKEEPVKQEQQKQPTQQKQQTTQPESHEGKGGRVLASPLARKLAEEKGYQIETIKGTGPGGRITKDDVLSHQPSQVKTTTAETTTAAPETTMKLQEVPVVAAYEDLDINNIRKVTAERLTFSKQNIPHYYLTIDCRVDNLLQLRKELNQVLEKEDAKISVNDMIVKAAALSMKKVPQVNSHWYGNIIRKYNDVHVGVAVNTDQGLFVPIVRDVEKKGFLEINSKIKQLAEKANENKLSIEDIEGATFTVSNLGMFGIDNFSAVINPPQSAILAVGSAQQKLIADGTTETGEIKVSQATFLKVTLSCDHRVIDGAVGAQWLAQFKSYIENPKTMLL